MTIFHNLLEICVMRIEITFTRCVLQMDPFFALPQVLEAVLYNSCTSQNLRKSAKKTQQKLMRLSLEHLMQFKQDNSSVLNQRHEEEKGISIIYVNLPKQWKIHKLL